MTRHPTLADPATPARLPEDLSTARVADLAREHPGTIRVFQRHRVDFCCGGKRSLAEAAARAGADLAVLTAELAALVGGTEAGGAAGAQAWLCALPAELADLAKLIVGRYHVALRGELPRLLQMAERVEKVHGGELPQTLPPLAARLRALAAELDAHLREEEEQLFPAIERLERAAGRGEATADLARLVAAREDEHAAAGEHLRELRRLADGFEPPEWACNTFRGLYHGLAELERELFDHIHLENNVLFPRALALGGA
jgi:regulator of cell morphogenesis and NO signaling